MNFQKRYNLENIINCRDLGGYPSEYGITQFGRFVRGGTVARPTDGDIEKLKELGVATVIDLRGEFETKNQPNDMERLTDNVTYLSLYEFNVAEARNSLSPLSRVYIHIAENYKESILAALKAIAAAPDGTILYHCFLGKDRTGILSMLLLSIAGVCEDDIVADYQITHTYIEAYLKSHADSLWETDPQNHLSLPQTMRELMVYINQEYGSVLDYIRSLGVTNDEIEAIRAKFF